MGFSGRAKTATATLLFLFRYYYIQWCSCIVMVRNNEHMFDKTNITPLGMDILLFLARSSGEEFYVRKIATTLGSSVSGTYTALEKLKEENLVTSRKSGRNVYYKENEENPSIRYFKIMMNIQELNQTVASIKEEADKIILFGSCSTGEDTMDSDIDLLVVTSEVDQTKKILRGKKINQRILKAIVVAPHQYMEMKQKDKAFYDETTKGIALWRRKDERL